MANGDDDHNGIPDDDPEQRIAHELERLGINSFAFQGLLDDAIAHAAVPARADATVRPWTPLGPRNIGGRIRTLVRDPKNPSTMYAGSAFGGVWKTTNRGDTWAPMDNFRPPNPPNAVRQALPIGAIGIAHSNTQVLYVGTGEPVMSTTGLDYFYPGFGLYRSSDGGATFNQIDHVDTGTIQARRYERILVDPWEPDRCWCACQKGLWRREPGGALTQDVVDPAGTPAAAVQHASDVLIDFGDPTATSPPATFTVYVALRTSGIYKSIFNRASASYTAPAGAVAGDTWKKLDSGISETNFNRIKIAQCVSQPRVVYAVFGLADKKASRVYRSADRGDSWEQTGIRADDDGKQAHWDLVLEVHPEEPDIVFTGSMELFRTINGGESWTRVLNWRLHARGDMAQHADQHALVFDGLEPRTIWLANDGGISMSRDLGTTWRERSHGILAAQIYDLAVHGRFPFIMGGGLQDNGTWVGYGGSTWYHVYGGDGGGIGFDPTSTQRYLVTSQDRIGRSVITATTEPLRTMATNPYVNLLPDRPDVPSPPAQTPRTKMRAAFTDLNFSITATGHGATFTGVVEHHPSNANHALLGRKQAAYVTTNGTMFTLLTTGAFTPVTAHVSAVAYAPSAPNTDWWIATSRNQVFRTSNAGGAWSNVSPPGAQVRWIADVAVHPTNPAIIALAVARQTGPPGDGQVFLSGDRGATWHEISGRSVPAGTPPGPTSPAADQLNPSAITSVEFDPQSPTNVAAPQTLYVGTMAGVYVIRNAMAPTTPPTAPAPAPVPLHPAWRTFNNNLPLTLIYDLAPVVVRDAARNIVRTMLRCATFGRGIFECDLSGAPNVRLYVRSTIIDDGYSYVNTPADDPRLVPPSPLVYDKAFDIRVDAPPFSFFEETLDGVEFDLELRHDQALAGERNVVYVQVHNAGTAVANPTVHLFFANAAGAPPAAPDLQANFWANLAADPIPGAPWQRVGPAKTAPGVGSAQPVVVRFDWTPPAGAAANVALLAVCTDTANDNVSAPTPTLQVDPKTHGATSLVRAERRAALHIVSVRPFVGDVFIRDGVDDDGRLGTVSWGGRSPDIVVRQAAEANPDQTFADLADLRPGDRVKGGTLNRIYVRVHNRSNVVVDAEVDLYQVPYATMQDPDTWTKTGADADSDSVADTVTVQNIPAKGWKFAPAIEWANPPDPDSSPDKPYKVHLLAAIVRRSDDERPSRATIADIRTFWKYFLGLQKSNNVALRALRFEP